MKLRLGWDTGEVEHREPKEHREGKSLGMGWVISGLSCTGIAGCFMENCNYSCTESSCNNLQWYFVCNKVLQGVVHSGSVLSFPYFVWATLSFGSLNKFKNHLLTWFDLTTASRICIHPLPRNFSCIHREVSSTKPIFFLWTPMST